MTLREFAERQTAYPQHLRTAVEHILNDQGLEAAEAEDQELPRTMDSGSDVVLVNWKRVEKFLGTLSDEDLETFCVGEQEDMVAIAKGREGKYAYRALDELFTSVGVCC